MLHNVAFTFHLNALIIHWLVELIKTNVHQLNIYYLYLVTTYKYLLIMYVKIKYKTLA